MDLSSTPNGFLDSSSTHSTNAPKAIHNYVRFLRVFPSEQLWLVISQKLMMPKPQILNQPKPTPKANMSPVKLLLKGTLMNKPPKNDAFKRSLS
jgi:hypothetical protein